MDITKTRDYFKGGIPMRFIYASFLSLFLLLNAHGTGRPIHSKPKADTKELIVALLGDTGAGSSFGSVLKLVAAERANVVMINGDFGYGSSASTWKKRLTESIDTEKHLVIGSLGNHDVFEKNNYISAFESFRTSSNGLKVKCTGTPGITTGHDIIIVDEQCTFGNVSIASSGIGQVLTESYLEERLENKLFKMPADNWKLVGYHFTLGSMNPGIKGTQSTAKFFDLIRQFGAIGVQAHTHSVMASCPISSPFTSGSAIPKCSPNFGKDLEDRFVLPGTGIYLDSSLVKEARTRGRCRTPNSADCKHMVDLISAEGYTRSDGTTLTNLADAGALFIIFNEGGDSKKASAYFKTIDGQTVFKFSITR